MSAAGVPAAVPLDQLRAEVKSDGHAQAALEQLPLVVLTAMRIVEKSGKPGAQKKADVIDMVRHYYTDAAASSADNVVYSIAADALSLLVPTLIESIVVTDKEGLRMGETSGRCLRALQCLLPVCCKGVSVVEKKVLP